MFPKVKICCIASEEEARMAIEAGASAIGLVARMPSGPGPIPDERILQIARSIPPPIASFMLTCETDSEAVVGHHLRTLTNTIQFVDAIGEGTYEKIRQAIPAVKLVQVVHVTGQGSVEEALRLSEFVDALLLDSGNPKAAVKELGGTGRTHDWRLSREIVEKSDIPVFLAGGLHAGNIRQALEQVAPYGVDLCSGVRTEGRLDPFKLEAFFKAVRR
jgi:phosphoribosylanthranilate isomerase